MGFSWDAALGDRWILASFIHSFTHSFSIQHLFTGSRPVWGPQSEQDSRGPCPHGAPTPRDDRPSHTKGILKGDGCAFLVTKETGPWPPNTGLCPSPGTTPQAWLRAGARLMLSRGCHLLSTYHTLCTPAQLFVPGWNLQTPHSGPVREVRLFSPFYRQENGGTER